MSPTTPPPSCLAVLFCIALLPLSSFILSIALLRRAARRLSFRSSTTPTPRITRTVLITGANTPEALALIRLLHASNHHRVVAADFERVPGASCARASSCVDKFYPLSHDTSLVAAGVNAASSHILFSTSVLSIASHEEPDLWIPCGSWPPPMQVSAVKRRLEERSPCKVLHPNLDTLAILTDDARFADFVATIDAGLVAPQVRTVYSRNDVHRALGPWPASRRFIMSKLADLPYEQEQDSPALPGTGSRSVSVASTVSNLTLPSAAGNGKQVAEVLREYAALEALILPSASMSDTYDRIASIDISKRQPWTLQELVTGPQYVAHTLIVANKVVAFVAASLSLRRPLQVLPEQTALAQRMGAFVAKLAEKLPAGTSTHLNIHFVLSEETAKSGVQQMLYPISTDVSPCVPGILYGEKAVLKLAQVVEDIAPPPCGETKALNGNGSGSGSGNGTYTGATSITGFYSLPRSILHLVLLPLARLLLLRGRVDGVLDGFGELSHRLRHGQEELLDWHDPWPWLWRWAVGLPAETFGHFALGA